MKDQITSSKHKDYLLNRPCNPWD